MARTCAGAAAAQHTLAKLPLRPFMPPGQTYISARWSEEYPEEQVFSLVTSHQSTLRSPGHPDSTGSRPTSYVMLDGQVQYGEPAQRSI